MNEQASAHNDTGYTQLKFENLIKTIYWFCTLAHGTDVKNHCQWQCVISKRSSDSQTAGPGFLYCQMVIPCLGKDNNKQKNHCCAKQESRTGNATVTAPVDDDTAIGSDPIHQCNV